MKFYTSMGKPAAAQPEATTPPFGEGQETLAEPPIYS
jgi:hypothetical protein